MTQHTDSGIAEGRSLATGVPLSERPLVADDQNTVISSPDRKREDAAVETAAIADSVVKRLFPAGGISTGEESGIRLAHFEIRERLGAGGMGAVFRATDLELARDVALKIMHPGASGDSLLVARFRNEARACAHLNHDNIARVYYAGSQDGLYFIAYELADGSTIKDLINKAGQLSPADTINYAIQVTLALNHIAAAGIVHRDIKPSNIMLTEAGRVKVVDLGLARRDVTDSIGDITVAGTTLGTFDYIAPEQAREPRNADIRSDIYSLGCTMYHMLTGQPPYPEGTALQKLLDHQGKSPPNPRSINAAITPELAAVMRKMMASNPKQRYQAPALLLSDLLHIAQLMGLQSIPAEGIVWRKLDALIPRQPLGAVWVFGSVLAICVTALILHRFPSNTEMQPLPQQAPESSIGVQIRPETFNSVTPGKVAKTPDSGKAAAGTPKTAMSEDGLNKQAVEPVGGMSASPEMLNVLPDAVIASIPVPDFSATVSPLTFLDLTGTVNPPPAVPSVRTAAQSEGPFVLWKTEPNQKPRSFSTLQGAVADARSGDVILLSYDGHPADLPLQPPVRITGINLIIRAAEGFRPTLEFDGDVNGSVARTEMFTLRNRGSLTIRDVDLRMRTRDDLTADRWSIFRFDGPNRVHLENVTVEVRNPLNESAFVFDLSEESAPAEAGTPQETAISMDRVACRGEVDGFRIASQPHGRIRLQHSAFAVSGTMFRNLGSAAAVQNQGSLELWMEHTSMILGESLIFMKDSEELTGRGPQRTLPRLTVNSDACVFASAVPKGRLVVSEGNSYVEEIEAALTWNGFTNLYYRFGTLWHIETAALDYTSRSMDVVRWREFWQNRNDSEENNAVELAELDWLNTAWISSESFQPGSVTPAMFQLNPQSFQAGNGRRPLARDGLVSGVAVRELPLFPKNGTLPESVTPAIPVPSPQTQNTAPQLPAGAVTPPSVAQDTQKR